MRDKTIWIFNAGNSFSGNPKWMFLYITRHHPEIKAYWFCYTDELVNYMKDLGYQACKFNTSEAVRIGKKAGVYVVEQNKEVIQEYLQGIIILNLWHGVGCKNIEKAVNEGWMAEGIAKKRILNNLFYKRDSLYLVTSPLMEEHFKKQCDIDEDKIIRLGYPRCENREKIQTFNHDVRVRKGLGLDTRIALYAPTFRDYNKNDFFPKAIPDVTRLIDSLEKANLLLIIKVHPQMEKDYYFNNLKSEYLNNKRILFWDNQNDIYEIMSNIDLGIIDYSSIFYDMVAMGVPRFIRYPFDINEGAVRDFAYDYYEMTCGDLCMSFDELLETLTAMPQDNQQAEIERINKLFWEYSDSNSCETLFERAMAFEPDSDYNLPTLYSFDIFDTLLGRTTIGPRGVFRYLQDKIRQSNLGFSYYFAEQFFKIRPWSEKNCRDYMNKTIIERGSDRCEITLDMIYEHMAEVYSLTEAQVEQLKKWEIEGELLCTIPYEDNIQKVLDLKHKGETVVLISDMYLPRNVIEELLAKNNPELLDIPLYLSCDKGHQKSKGTLYLDVYHDLDYCFREWVHCGDNSLSDKKMPEKLGITVNQYVPPAKFAKYENEMNRFADTFDFHQVSALFARFRAEHPSEVENRFAYCYASLYFVPYVDWVINHAIAQGMQNLFYISRDGYLLKLAADALIKEMGYPIKTKYIYGSRKAWRVPSQIGELDSDFFGKHGNFTGVHDYESLLTAAKLDSDEFCSLFPEFAFMRNKAEIATDDVESIVHFLKNSKRYNTFLLKRAEEERDIVNKYLSQEINFDDKNAFVEYWARGYTQTCLANLIESITGKNDDCVFYYARSIYPSQGNYKRYNFTTNTYSMLFIEALFANMPYESVSGYIERDGKIEPIIISNDNNSVVMQALEDYIPRFVHDFSQLTFIDRDTLIRNLYDFGLSYFHRHQSDFVFTKCIAPLHYSQTIYGDPIEYAPSLDMGNIADFLNEGDISTQSKKMSIARSRKRYRKVVEIHEKIKKKKPYTVLKELQDKAKKRFKSK